MTSLDIPATVQTALAHHQAGRLPQAEALYRQVLAAAPNHADALHLLGLIAHQTGDHATAVALIDRAIAVNPSAPAFHNNCGEAYRAMGKLEEAIACYEKTLTLDPGFVDAYSNRGVAYQAQGRTEEAIACYQRALALQPNYVKAHNNLGFAFQKLGRLEEAIACYQRALALKPDYAQAHHNLGCVLQQQNRLPEAIACYERALALKPDYLEARNNLGNTFQEMGHPAQAAACYEQVLKLNPDSAEGHAGLAIAFQAQGKIQEAIAHYEQALSLNPDDVHTRHMLAAIGGAPIPLTAHPEYVSKLFDKYADRFDQHLVEILEYRTPQALNDAIRRALGDRPGRLDVIDLGCGTGLCGPLLRDLARTLVGVDLSPKMIEKARARNVYDSLTVADIVTALSTPGASYDLVIAADVFVYIGELTPIFEVCATVLNPCGLFAFSVEAAEEDVPYALRATGRYAHSLGYIRKLAQAVGFNEIIHDRVVVRKEKSKPMPGHIFVLARP